MGQETLPFLKQQLKIMDMKNHQNNQFHQIQQQATYRKKTWVFLSNVHFSQHFRTIITRPPKKKKKLTEWKRMNTLLRKEGLSEIKQWA